MIARANYSKEHIRVPKIHHRKMGEDESVCNKHNTPIYAYLNYKEAYAPQEIKTKSISMNEDSGMILSKL